LLIGVSVNGLIGVDLRVHLASSLSPAARRHLAAGCVPELRIV
jgi:hypothetical protein